VSTFQWSEIDRRAVDTVRVLAMDAVEKAGNGHPGTAMSLAPAAYLLFQRFLRHDPSEPGWAGRDRFVLSCGHASLTSSSRTSPAADSTWTTRQLRVGSLTLGHPSTARRVERPPPLG
jgi:transketolase